MRIATLMLRRLTLTQLLDPCFVFPGRENPITRSLSLTHYAQETARLLARNQKEIVVSTSLTSLIISQSFSHCLLCPRLARAVRGPRRPSVHVSPWKAVMGVWRAGGNHSPNLPHLFHSSAILVLIASLMAVAGAKPHECKVEQCSQQYQTAVERSKIMQGPNTRYCSVLHDYLVCLRGTARACRGRLEYHTMSSLVVQWNKEYNCSYLRDPDEQPFLEIPTQQPSSQCVYRGRHVFATCSLFGDPHLTTFNGETQTCKILGAWPLIDNAYLAVQVTNEAVVKGLKASATSKITVIIKEFSQCSQQKTYEATKDYLPGTFVDGTQSSGAEKSVQIRESPSGRHVEINIKYIGTTIVIRQVGHYLTFVIRVPSDVANQGLDPDELQLCVKGCPSMERINYRNVVSSSSLHASMSRGEAISRCRAHNFTRFYFESCVFDLVTTGDSSFLQAASQAMMDNLALTSRNNQLHNNQKPMVFVELQSTKTPPVDHQPVMLSEAAVRSLADSNCIFWPVLLLAIILLVIDR